MSHAILIVFTTGKGTENLHNSISLLISSMAIFESQDACSLWVCGGGDCCVGSYEIRDNTFVRKVATIGLVKGC